MSTYIDGQDDLDRGLDLARTVWLALHVKALLTEETIKALANTLSDAISVLDNAKGKFATFDSSTIRSVDNGDGCSD